MIQDIGIMRVMNMKYARIYFELIAIDEDCLVALDISVVDNIGDRLGYKIGYDHFHFAEYIDIDDEKSIFKYILGLRELQLIDFLNNPLNFDREHVGFTDLTIEYISKIFNGYVENKYPELLI